MNYRLSVGKGVILGCSNGVKQQRHPPLTSTGALPAYGTERRNRVFGKVEAPSRGFRGG